MDTVKQNLEQQVWEINYEWEQKGRVKDLIWIGGWSNPSFQSQEFVTSAHW